MEDYPNSSKHEIVETPYSEKFYELVEQMDRLKSRAKDSNLPEEERRQAQADIEKWGKKFEEAFDFFDAKDKEEQARRIGSQSLNANRLEAEQIGQRNDGQTYVDSQGVTHSTPEDSRASEPDYWQKTA